MEHGTGDLVGRDLGRFHLIEKDRASGDAARYAAVDGSNRFWVEVLSAELSDVAVQRLRDLLAALSRRARAPEIVEFGEWERNRFIVVPRQHGEYLGQRLQRGSLGALETVELMIELANALQEAHALGIAHGNLDENQVFFATNGAEEAVEILGFGLAGLRSSLDLQPSPKDDLAALGRIAYACLAADEARSGPPAQVLEKQRNLPAEVRRLVVSLLDGSSAVDSAARLRDQAEELRRSLTTEIGPVRPPKVRDGQKIEVVLRTTVAAAEANGEAPAEDSAAADSFFAEAGAAPAPARERAPKPPDRTLLVVGIAVIVLILGLWLVMGESGSDVVVEPLAPR
jgi:hypothetical protein